MRLAAQQLICSRPSIEKDQERPRWAHIIKESLRTESFTQHDFLFFTSAANYLFPVSGEMFQESLENRFRFDLYFLISVEKVSTRLGLLRSQGLLKRKIKEKVFD